MYRLYLFDQYEQLSEQFIVHAMQFLPEDRRIRALRYRRRIDRWNCVVAYLMLMYGLRECFGITSFEMAFGEYGKPYLTQYPHVHFNISHCDAGCAVAVADCPVGVDIQDRTNSEYNFSTTVIRGRLNDLLAKGEALSKAKDIEQAFQCYANAAEIIKKNPDVFKPEKRLGELRKIRSFYESNGYIFESGELIKQILVLTEQIYSPESIELAKCYHEIGYTYERYLYYKLMLRAMLRSHEILEKCANIPEKHTDFLNAAALIYISLGYAYLENNDPDNAKIWYQKADELRRHHEQELDKSQKAFLYNGLHSYYYSILKDSKEALCMLNIALALRKELNKERDFNDVVTRVIPVHIINTHSNKIHIYLEEGQTGDAEKEFNDFQDARGALVGRKDLHDSERRILTDHGDVLTACGNHQDAYAEYQKALQHRKYLHFADDIFAAELYWKIGNSLKHITGSGNAERALEYLIQSHTIYRKILGADNKNAHETWEDILSLGKLLGYTEDIISKRHAAQLEFLEYRYDDRKDNRETELIEFYKL